MDYDPAPPTPYIPSTPEEQIIIKHLLQATVFGRPMHVMGKDREGRAYQAEITGYPGYWPSGEHPPLWDEQGYYNTVLDISPKDTPVLQLEGTCLPVKLWIEVSPESYPFEESLHIRWSLEASEWGTKQSGNWPSPPVLSVPEWVPGEEGKQL